MPDYDSIDFEPPAPVAHVALKDERTGATQGEVPMLLDTGADVTLIPLHAATAMNVEIDPNKRYEIVAFDSSSTLAPVVRLELHFCNRTFRGQFLVIDQAWGVLGRNILNLVPLVLDGPRSRWDEYR
jgi:hypothetical protein